jgi:hypothetical protein
LNAELRIAEAAGQKAVEGPPDAALMTKPDDVSRVIEACFSARALSALLYARNLTPAFFDLSSGEAGAILQKLRNYRIRLAVVCPPGEVAFSSRFGEMVAEERRGPHFRLFETRQAAWDWLTAASPGASE